MLSFIMGFLKGTIFGILIGFIGGIVAVCLAKPYLGQIKEWVDHAFEILS